MMAETIGNGIRVMVERTPLTTLWLDTSVVSDLVKLDQQKIVDPRHRARLERLQLLVFDLVRVERLLCPQAGHREEYVRFSLGKECARKWAQLSQGVSLEPEAHVEDAELFEAMKAYVRGEPSFSLPTAVFFGGNPMAHLRQTERLGLVIWADIDDSQALAQLKEEVRQAARANTEAVRLATRARGTRYTEQLELELGAHAKMVDAAIARKREWLEQVWAISPTQRDVEQLFQDLFPNHPWVNYWWQVWKVAAGEPTSPEAMREFFRSGHHRALPCVQVTSALLADLMTGDEPVKESDSQDVAFLSKAIPVAHYVVTDNRMRERLQAREVLERWGTQVFSMKTIDGLVGELEKLRV